MHFIEADLDDNAVAGWLAPDIARLERLLGSWSAFEQYLLTRTEHHEQG